MEEMEEMMPDQQRVARIYLPTTTVELLESGKNCWMLGMQTEPSERFPVPFEPAVPRCKTCDCFRVRAYGNTAFCNGSLKNDVPADGSGYCHEHEEKHD